MKKGDSCTFMRKGIPMANKEPMQTKYSAVVTI